MKTVVAEVLVVAVCIISGPPWAGAVAEGSVKNVASGVREIGKDGRRWFFGRRDWCFYPICQSAEKEECDEKEMGRYSFNWFM